jgi:hypothetical protein
MSPTVHAVIPVAPVVLVTRAAALAAAATLGLASCGLAVRRAAGALTQPLETPALWAAAVLLAAVAAGIRCAWFRTAIHAATARGLRDDDGFGEGVALWRHWGILAFPAACVAMIAAALSIPGTSTAGLVALWGVPIVGEAIGIAWLRRARRTPDADSTRVAPHTPAKTPRAMGHDAADHDAADHDATYRDAAQHDAAYHDATIIQRLVRRRGLDGGDVLDGWLRADFAPSGRMAALHVAFCPPFDRTPEVHVEQLTGPAATVKPSQAYPFGVRIDIKLASPTPNAASVAVEFLAREKAGA